MFRSAIQSSARRVMCAPKPAITPFMSRGVGSFGQRHDNNPDIIEKGKRDNLRKQDPNNDEVPHWNESIASDSEAFVKASRHDTEHAEKDPKTLAEESTKILKEARKREEQEGSQ